MNNAHDGRPPGFLWMPADWLASAKVRVMSRAERSCYFDLLCHQWVEGSIPSDVEELAALLGEQPDGFRAAWERRIARMFVPLPADPSRLVNERLERERQLQAEIRRERSESGRRGNAVRWGGDRTAISQPSLSDRSAIAEGSPAPAPAPAPAPEQNQKAEPRERPPAAALAGGALFPGVDPGKKAPRKPSGPAQEAAAHWVELFAQATDGEQYELVTADWVALASLVKLKTYSPKVFHERALALLSTADPFWVTNRNLRTLCSRWNDVAQIPRADAERAARRPQDTAIANREAIMAAQHMDTHRNGSHTGNSDHAVPGNARPVLRIALPAGGQLPAGQDRSAVDRDLPGRGPETPDRGREHGGRGHQALQVALPRAL